MNRARTDFQALCASPTPLRVPVHVPVRDRLRVHPGRRSCRPLCLGLGEYHQARVPAIEACIPIMILPLQLPAPFTIAPPTGASRLPFVELPKAKVQKPRARVKFREGSQAQAAADSSYGNFSGHITFSAWQFFHAAAKTEFAMSFTPAEADQAAMLYAAQHNHLLIWNTQNLRIRDQGVFSRVDATRSYIAGRFGVAASSLLMQHWDYPYWDHIPSLWERAARNAQISHAQSVQMAQVIAAKIASGRPQNEPDFAFEKAVGDVALMESKGKFVNPGDTNPPVKADMNEALGQLGAWSGFISPNPGKSFGIGTYLREQTDSAYDPSLILYVDPPAEKQTRFEPVPFPRDWIRRGNFGNWLMRMGLVEAGLALRDGREKLAAQISLPVVEMSGRKFAFTVHAWNFAPMGRGFPFLPFSELFLDLGFVQTFDLLVTGLEVNVLGMIEKSLRSAEASSLLKAEPVSVSETPGWFSGSIMRDGSLLGLLHLGRGFRAGIGEQKFAL